MYQGVVSSYSTPESALSPEDANGDGDSYFPTSVTYQGVPFERHPATQPRVNFGMPIREDRRPGSAEVDTSGVHISHGISQRPSNPSPTGDGNGFVQGSNNPSPKANAEYPPIDYYQAQPFAATEGWRKFAAKHRQVSRAREYGGERHVGPLTDSKVLNRTPNNTHHHAATVPYPPGLGYGSSMHNDHLSLFGYSPMPPHQGMSDPQMAMPRPMYPNALPPTSSVNIRGGHANVVNPRRPLQAQHHPEPQRPVASTSATPSNPHPFNPQIPKDLPRYPSPPGPPPGYPFHNGPVLSWFHNLADRMKLEPPPRPTHSSLPSLLPSRRARNVAATTPTRRKT
ncbi:hypothetical protein JAAARDRAFT_59974 [Jaapia argillacea MUCL 33604]|uniref:Uncharacterized protein n=1 Tax=Jaapia argillacea MUCL 33604 TaxID=933084 RepID=A0A067PL16_9AGAM|nr:hypothetical protein JAAARDRAFT_59974 [Jaapia argillacea MUCL 33604]